MSGSHRRKPGTWEPAGPLAVVLPLAAIALVIFVAARHPSWLLILLGALDGVIVIRAAHRLVLNLASGQPQTAGQLVNRLSLTAQLIGAIVLALASIGQLRGWMHGMFRDVIISVLVLYVISSPIYWLGGKRRLIAFLSARATGDGPGL